MKRQLSSIFPQPMVGAGTAVIAILSWVVTASAIGVRQIAIGLDLWVVAAMLVVALVVAYRYPIHVRHHAKVVMSSVPRFILAILLPPPAAVAAAMVGTTLGELATRKERGLYFSDIATEVGRTMICVLAASTVAHVTQAGGMSLPASLILAALVPFLADVITSPLLLCPMSGDNPFSVVRAMLCGSGPAEGAQYLLGVIGAIVAHDQPFAVSLLAIPTVLVYVAYKNVEEVHDGTRRILESIADTVDLRDPYTGGHSKRVAELTQDILRHLGMHGPEAELIAAVARVHDIGKIAIPDTLLNKPEALTDDDSH